VNAYPAFKAFLITGSLAAKKHPLIVKLAMPFHRPSLVPLASKFKRHSMPQQNQNLKGHSHGKRKITSGEVHRQISLKY